MQRTTTTLPKRTKIPENSTKRSGLRGIRKSPGKPGTFFRTKTLVKTRDKPRGKAAAVAMKEAERLKRENVRDELAGARVEVTEVARMEAEDDARLDALIKLLCEDEAVQVCVEDEALIDFRRCCDELKRLWENIPENGEEEVDEDVPEADREAAKE